MKHGTLRSAILKIPFSVGLYKTMRSIASYPTYITDYFSYLSKNKKDRRFTAKFTDLFPCLIDKTPTTHFEPHYLYHPAWAARVIAKNKPAKHTDIGSSLKFCTVVSAFIPVEFYDYRPAQLNLSGLISKEGNLTDLNIPDGSIPSLSCMHTIEHIGLGRYGDPIDPKGDITAASELTRVLAPGGTFIFVTPVGKSKISFNAHRIYSYQQVLDLFPELHLEEFSMVPDDYKKYGLVENADPEDVAKQSWACGCFAFTKNV